MRLDPGIHSLQPDSQDVQLHELHNITDQHPDGRQRINQFSVAPTNGTLRPMNATDQSYFSVFEMLSVMQGEDEGKMVSCNECALWFCISAYSISMDADVQNESMVAN